jgi:hypothetical protein
VKHISFEDVQGLRSVAFLSVLTWFSKKE